MAKVIILSGSNSGKREFFLRSAIELIQTQIGPLGLSSSVYETEPWGFVSEQQFLNQVWMVETNLTPHGVLGQLLDIEMKLGRIRESQGGYVSRVIDLDILYYDEQILNDEELSVPHPRIQERNFVLQPLVEILPHFVHPVLGLTNTQLLEKCQDIGLAKKVIR